MEAKKITPVFDDLNDSAVDNPVQLRPKFNDAILTSETLKNGVQSLVQTVDELQNEFPVEVFPKDIQNIIKATNQSLNYPIDFISTSILYAISVSLGNTYKVELKRGWQENAVVYFAIVGRAGTNKSHPISFALKPIDTKDKDFYSKYQTEKSEFDRVSKLTKKEREKEGLAEPVRPMLKQHLVSDFTPEALTDVHKFNKRGIGVYVDELASWFNNFNRYNKGSEEQFWLSIWSGKPIRINRKTSEPTFIPLPFISVIGTIQTGVLKTMAKDRTENGFLDRVLFTVPVNLKKEYWSEKELPDTIELEWQNIMSKILELPVTNDETHNPSPMILKFKSKAKSFLFKWQRALTDQSNALENETLCGINSKMEMHAVRLALILQMARFACGEDNKDAIGIEAVKGAIKLTEYFRSTAKEVQNIITDKSPLEHLPADKKALYSALPKNFIKSKGTAIAESLSISERTFGRFLKNKELFFKVKQGEYEKLF